MNKTRQLLSFLACLAFTGAAFAAPTDVAADAPTGKKVEISAKAEGTAPLSFLWFKAPLSEPTAFIALPAGNGSSSDTLTIPSATVADAGVYRAEISNSAGKITSPTATIKVITAPTLESFTVTVSEK